MNFRLQRDKQKRSCRLIRQLSDHLVLVYPGERGQMCVSPSPPLAAPSFAPRSRTPSASPPSSSCLPQNVSSPDPERSARLASTSPSSSGLLTHTHANTRVTHTFVPTANLFFIAVSPLTRTHVSFRWCDPGSWWSLSPHSHTHYSSNCKRGTQPIRVKKQKIKMAYQYLRGEELQILLVIQYRTLKHTVVSYSFVIKGFVTATFNSDAFKKFDFVFTQS